MCSLWAAHIAEGLWGRRKLSLAFSKQNMRKYKFHIANSRFYWHQSSSGTLCLDCSSTTHPNPNPNPNLHMLGEGIKPHLSPPPWSQIQRRIDVPRKRQLSRFSNAWHVFCFYWCRYRIYQRWWWRSCEDLSRRSRSVTATIWNVSCFWCFTSIPTRDRP